VSGEHGFEVQATALITHATTVDQVADLVGEGRSAAAAVGLGRDAYGVLCQLIPALLDSLHEATITALQDAADSLQRSADDLRATARDYTGSDQRTAQVFRGGSTR
jgi:hypothetical protein